GLNTRAVAAGKQYFGSAVDSTGQNDAAYMNILSNTADFGSITPANAMKWDTVERSRNSFNFAPGDSVVAIAAKNGQHLRCHTLVWHSQLPSWVGSSGFNNATLIEVMKNHITRTVTQWKGKCKHWDVVNEALNEDGSYRSSPFYNIIGEAFIPIAFATAAAADPQAVLFYNDYNIETPGAKSSGAQRIVRLVKQYGAKIDGVGQQAHLIVGSSPSVATWTSNINAFTSLGVDVAITELDIRTNTPASSSAVAQQAIDYANAVNGCKSDARCVGITIWDFTDKYSWIPSVFPGQGSALPWDSNLNKKQQVYSGILNAFGSAGGTPTSSPTTSPTATPTTTPTDTPTITPTTSPTTEPTSKWQQCGGQEYSGPTECVSGTTCTVLNPWYSQCL
ncbi:carbohydrate-binding module family 1 protein, partial [Periconia macrospinosa]